MRPPERPDPLTRVADAIERLTTQHREITQLPGGKRHFSRHAALLAQLRGAIGGDVGGSGGAAKPANERTPVDPDALQKYVKLVTQVHEFYFDWTGKRVRDIRELPEPILARAHGAFRLEVSRGTVPDSYILQVARMWEARAAIVDEKLTPGTTIELLDSSSGRAVPFPCPECGATWYEKVLNRGLERVLSDGRQVSWYEREKSVALTATYQTDGLGGLSKSFVRCGCCDSVWKGDAAMRWVAWELEHAGQPAEPDPDEEAALAEARASHPDLVIEQVGVAEQLLHDIFAAGTEGGEPDA